MEVRLVDDPDKSERKILKNFIKVYKPKIYERVIEIYKDEVPDKFAEKQLELMQYYQIDQFEAADELLKEIAFIWMFRGITYNYLKRTGLIKEDFISACHRLHPIISLFQKDGDYSEDFLVLDDDFFKALEELPLNNVSYIGWLYQYYISELHDNYYSSKGKIRSQDDLVGATGIYTPHWVIRYMVENSLGRIWINHLKANDKELDGEKTAKEFGWKYYLEEAEQPEEVNEQLDDIRKTFKDEKPESISFLEPCMGTGFILLNALEMFIQIYRDSGIATEEATRSILKNNLYGCDIDNKAYRIAKACLVIHAAEYDSSILNEKEIKLHLHTTYIDGRDINQNQILWFGDSEEVEGLNRIKGSMYVQRLCEDLSIVTQTGMLCIPSCKYDFDLTRKYINSPDNFMKDELIPVQFQLNNLLDLMELMSRKYSCVVTNPPYLNSKNYNADMKKFVNEKHLQLPDDLDLWDYYSDALVKSFMEMINLPEQEEVKEQQISFF